MPELLVLGAVVLLAAAAATWLYVRWEHLDRRSWPLIACRTVALTVAGVLLLDLSCGIRSFSSRPLVLLDGSLSMAAAGGQWRAARDSALGWGIVRMFGDAAGSGDSTPDRGASRLGPALAAAAAAGRRVVVVSDGEVDDAANLPADLLAGASIRIFPRRVVPDAAVTELVAPERVALDDTLDVDVTVGRWGAAPDSAVVTLAADRRIAVRAVHFDGSDRRQLRFRLPARLLGAGDHLLRASVRAARDSEPRDDERWALVHVAATPGIVVVAAPPDWDSRQLVRTLRDVSDLPVRAFVRMGARWWSADRLASVSGSAVLQAARHADLLVTKGAPGPDLDHTTARARWRWLDGASGAPPLPGDWYVSTPGPSPLSGIGSVTAMDSLPPLVDVTPIASADGGWIGLVARNDRRGGERPVIVGQDVDGHRDLVVAGEGLWRWAFTGGASEAAYRELIASATAWLLGATDPKLGEARPVRAVVPRGVPLGFEWTARGRPVPVVISWTGDSIRRTDTLHFDGAGRTTVLLPVGLYRYHLADGGTGTVAVEPWSREFLPRTPTLRSRSATGTAAGIAEPARDRLWLFAIVLAALSAEWALRRRRGLR